MQSDNKACSWSTATTVTIYQTTRSYAESHAYRPSKIILTAGALPFICGMFLLQWYKFVSRPVPSSLSFFFSLQERVSDNIAVAMSFCQADWSWAHRVVVAIHWSQVSLHCSEPGLPWTTDPPSPIDR